MRYDIKPDHHIKAKRGYLAAFYIELFLTLQAGMVLVPFSAKEAWRKVMAIVGGGLGLGIAGGTFWKERRVGQESKKEAH